MKRQEAHSIIEGYSDIRKKSEHTDYALYEALEDANGRKVSLRVFNRDVTQARELRLACAQELHVLTRLIHPNILTVTAYGMWRSNPYAVALSVQGMTLKQAIQQDRLSMEDKYHAAVDVLRAVQHAHRNGVVHGNIDPNNIIFGENNQAYLTNFNLRSLQDKPNDITDYVGSQESAFIAPERKIDSRTNTTATDVYALGVLCFYLFTREIPEVVTQEEVSKSAGLDLTLRRTLMSMMSRDAHLRPLDLEVPIQLFLRLAASLHAKDQPIDPDLAESLLPPEKFLFLDTLHELVDDTVYLYHQRSDQKLFIAKSRDPKAAGYMEARKLMSVSHPHIVPVIGAARNRLSQVVVTAYCSGGDLLGRMAHPWPVETSLEFLENMLSALELAHGLGVVHNNLRPWHILIDEEGMPAISDFGLSPEVLGPEISHGYAIPGEAPSAQADLFALGVLVYELIVGSRPYYIGEKLDAAPRFANIPRSTRIVLENLLEISPEKRASSAGEALHALQVARGKIKPSAPNIPQMVSDNDPMHIPLASDNSIVRGLLLGGVGALILGLIIWFGVTFSQTGSFWPPIGLEASGLNTSSLSPTEMRTAEASKS